MNINTENKFDNLKTFDKRLFFLVKISPLFYAANVIYRIISGSEHYWGSLVVPLLLTAAFWIRGKGSWLFLVTATAVQCGIHGLQAAWTGLFIIYKEAGIHSNEIFLRRSILFAYHLMLLVFTVTHKAWFTTDNRAFALWKRVAFVSLALSIPLFSWVEQSIKVAVDPTVIKYDSEIGYIRFSSDGKKIAAIKDKTLIVWDVATKKVSNIRSNHGEICSADFSSDGKYLALGTRHEANTCDGNLYIDLLEISTGQITSLQRKETFENQHDHRIGAKFSPDSRYIAAEINTKAKTTIDIWDMSTKTLQKTIGGEIATGGVVYSPDGRYLADIGDHGSIFLWNINEGKIIKKIKTQVKGGWIIHFSPDGKYIALAFNKTMSNGESKAGSEKGTIEIWEIATETKARVIEWDSDVRVKGFMYSPDGKYLASCGDEEIVRIWDVQTGKQVKTLEGHPARLLRGGLAYSPDGKFLAASGGEYIKLWNINP